MKGTLVTTKVPILGNKIGAVGVCYHVYDDDSSHIVEGYIFENGHHDGFSIKDRNDMLEAVGHTFVAYNFANVLRLGESYYHREFDEAFRLAREKADYLDKIRHESTDEHNDGFVKAGYLAKIKEMTSW